jgi:hypothetical protein
MAKQLDVADPRPPARAPLAAELVPSGGDLVCFLPSDPASLLRAALVCKSSCRMVSGNGFYSWLRIVSSEASTNVSAAPQLLVQARLRGKTWRARAKVRDSRTRMGSVDAIVFSQLMLQRVFRAVDFVGQWAEAVVSREDGRGRRLPVHPQKSQLTANRRHNNCRCTYPYRH